MKKFNTKSKKQKDENIEQAIGPWKMVWDRFKKNKIALVGLGIFALILIMVIFAPAIAPYDPDFMDFAAVKQPPSSAHLLGTDEIGRDYFSRLLYGGRVSLQVGVVAVVISVVLGVVVGGIAGYYGGWIDNILMRFAEIIYSFPFIPLVITLSAALQGRVDSATKMYMVMALIGLLSWPGLARMIRGQILTLREQEFMEAATALGISDYSKIVKHLLPNTLGYIIVFAMLRFAGAILSEASLSFLGLGVTPPTPTWGNMLQYAKKGYYLKNFPWLWIPPGMCIFLAVVSINLLGEGLRDAFDPKSN